LNLRQDSALKDLNDASAQAADILKVDPRTIVRWRKILREEREREREAA